MSPPFYNPPPKRRCLDASHQKYVFVESTPWGGETQYQQWTFGETAANDNNDTDEHSFKNYIALQQYKQRLACLPDVCFMPCHGAYISVYEDVLLEPSEMGYRARQFQVIPWTKLLYEACLCRGIQPRGLLPHHFRRRSPTDLMLFKFRPDIVLMGMHHLYPGHIDRTSYRLHLPIKLPIPLVNLLQANDLNHKDVQYMLEHQPHLLLSPCIKKKKMKETAHAHA
jgi:hypothetical protein